MNPILTYSQTATFEQQYILLRKKEGRIYSDAELRLLPETAPLHPYHKEWNIRNQSLQKLLKIINRKGGKINILEVGCGNGWLSAKLAQHTKAQITGIDINRLELRQANRIFKAIPNLRFVNGRLQDEQLKDTRFDIILFAASIQYFPSFKKIIHTAMEYLTLQGEIHIVDSPFYLQHELDAAKQRTKNYFTGMGCTGMTAYYFHHCVDDLKRFNARILYNPRNILNRWFRKIPFHHVMIKNQYH
ncbi:MAG: class I SAM-dependent methyltransferase [Bacteroidetes bacterium]|nr:class I SAM-dependent methyltransferase [Bacteroidota bacterium]